MTLPFVQDSRRLTGASLVIDVPGAILEVAAPGKLKTVLRVYWRHAVRKLMNALGWHGEKLATLDHGKSQILAISAPIDLLLVATFVTEWAWEAALQRAKHPNDAFKARDFQDVCDELLSRIAETANPRLQSLYRAARIRKCIVLLSEKDLSIGEGAGAKVFAFDDLPLPDDISWRPKRRRIPIALVTGTNGKTTTVRLLARILSKTNLTVGYCNTDTIQIGAETLQRDDYSGPTGARIVLRDERVEAAVLEVARGGMLRRGLQVSDADVGLVTNVADDHLGENGIHNLAQLALAKFTITRGLRASAPLVVNADDVHCRALARTLKRPIVWFSLTRPVAALRRTIGQATWIYVDNAQITLEQAEVITPIIAVQDCPLSFGGTAVFNTSNILAATATAICMGVSVAHIQSALAEFGSTPDDNPGRLNRYTVRGATVLVDYGHNPDGIAAVLACAKSLPHKRLLIATGLPGDRSDQAAQQVGQIVAACKPDRVLVKELPNYLRGRELGEMSGLIAKALRAGGLAGQRLALHDNETSAVTAALAWVKPGDLVVLFSHENGWQLREDLAALEP